jgi:hypothetical protein
MKVAYNAWATAGNIIGNISLPIFIISSVGFIIGHALGKYKRS